MTTQRHMIKLSHHENDLLLHETLSPLYIKVLPQYNI